MTLQAHSKLMSLETFSATSYTSMREERETLTNQMLGTIKWRHLECYFI